LFVVFWFFFFSSRRRHTRFSRDWSSDVCSSDLGGELRDGRQRRDLVEVELVELLAVVELRRRRDAVGPVAEETLVEVKLEDLVQIGRASCRERVEISGGAV